MRLEALEKLFQESWMAMTKKKLILVFFTLCLSGLIVVFSRVLAIGSNSWVLLSLSFLPMIVSTTLLFALGIALTLMLQSEEKGPALSFSSLIAKSWKPIVSICYITLPLFLVYLVAWLVLGVFFLFKEIPGIGDFIGVFLSFGPFILITSTLILTFLNVAVLFFMTPAIALKEHLDLSLWKEVAERFKKNILLNGAFLVIASLPILFILSFLIGAAALTKMSYFHSTNPLLVGMQWFFLMLPFNALLSPFVLFFFNFSAKTYFCQNKAVSQDLSI